MPKSKSGSTGGDKKTAKPGARASTNTSGAAKPADTRRYTHPEAQSLLRPDVGLQSSFRKKKPPQAWRYDSSLSPALEWDGQNPAREVGTCWRSGTNRSQAFRP